MTLFTFSVDKVPQIRENQNQLQLRYVLHTPGLDLVSTGGFLYRTGQPRATQAVSLVQAPRLYKLTPGVFDRIAQLVDESYR